MTGSAGSRSATSRRPDEAEITTRESAAERARSRSGLGSVVELVRLTRTHPELRVGFVGARCDRHVCRRLFARRDPRPLEADCSERVARRRTRRAVGPDPPPRGRCPEPPRTSSASCGSRCSAAAPVRRVPAREKPAPRLGPRPPAEVAAQREGGRRGPTRRSPRAVRRTTSRRELAAQSRVLRRSRRRSGRSTSRRSKRRWRRIRTRRWHCSPI